MFFIPCSSSSPIAAPPPPASLTPGEIAKWVGRLALNAAPLLTVYVCDRLWWDLRQEMWQYIRSRLPTPTWYASHKTYIAAIREARAAYLAGRPAPEEALSETTPQTQPPAADSTTEGQTTPEGQAELNAGGFAATSEMRPRDEPHIQSESGPVEEGAPVTTDPVSLGTVGRQSTFSTHGVAGGGDSADAYYASDDEDNSGDMVSTTLISFDVEATDATDPPPGQWSAELRPNVVEGNRSEGTEQNRHARQPIYRSTILTRLPSVLGADMLAWAPSRLLSAATDAMMWRWVVRSFLSARGLSVEALYPVLSFGLSRQAVASFIGIELVHFFILADIWAAMYPVASFFRMSDEEWDEEQSYMDGSGTLLD